MRKLILNSGNGISNRLIYSCLIAVVFVFILASCGVPKNAYYFKNIKNDTTLNTIGRGEDLKIQKNDLLLINFSSLNPAEDMIYNAPVLGGGVSATASSAGAGYAVDQQGNIQLHKLGVIAVEGLTRAALKDKLQKDISPYLKDPVVTVRFQNHKITILGEVSKPQVIPMPEERLSILEVLAGSGDVSQFARRDNILIIRETATGKDFKRINLENHTVFSSDYFWLQPGDVVYVEPNDVKVNEAKRVQNQQNISIGLSALSIAVIILSRIIK